MSNKTEVKSIEDLKKYIEKEIRACSYHRSEYGDNWKRIEQSILEDILDKVNQLEESETPSKEKKYYVVKSEGLDGAHYYFITFNAEMNGLFTLHNGKERAYIFDDKEKAQAIANYTNSKVEELEE